MGLVGINIYAQKEDIIKYFLGLPIPSYRMNCRRIRIFIILIIANTLDISIDIYSTHSIQMIIHVLNINVHVQL